MHLDPAWNMLADTARRQTECAAKEAREVVEARDDTEADNVPGKEAGALLTDSTLQDFPKTAMPPSSAAQQSSSMPEAVQRDDKVALAPIPQTLPAVTGQDSFLLNLPPELRTEIYSLAVKSPTRHIIVDADGYDRPPVLGTCKEVRADALKLFYCTNTFTVLAVNYNYATMARFLALLGTLKISKNFVKYYFDMIGRPNWSNLRDWVKRYHAGEEDYLPPARKQTKERILLRALFDTARVMRGQEWRLVKKVMSAMRPALIDLDARWAQ
ncbi:hypothetical protein TI39_contig350g00029 [Zymoseptoria brevis]|uniref:Uncharacterized protein n=1 Tax=Zymoseptoria brevis TaxID=1047168 RepID=A0A0F4GRG9_9PEZI|nr:hypothetical protein TI39_contig350g00029 [Zymoseptoria brevis]